MPHEFGDVLQQIILRELVNLTLGISAQADMRAHGEGGQPIFNHNPLISCKPLLDELITSSHPPLR